jgi:exodeoxyribonuclease V alpha subunit
MSKSDVRNQIVLGYASTVHKLQGSDSPVVIGSLDFSVPPKMLTCQLLYTLLTRAKKRCIVVAENNALAKAIATDYVSTKRTFLKELLETE